MKKRQWVCVGLLAALACQGESALVGESLDEPLLEGQGPTQSGTTNQFIAQIRVTEDPERCMPRLLPVRNGVPECVLAEVIPGGADETACSCDQPGRRPLNAKMNEIVLAQLPVSGLCNVEVTCTHACACEVVPADRDVSVDDLQGAEAVLASSRRKFPRPVLEQERDALTIEIMRRKGRASEAASLARDFTSKYPNSPPHTAGGARASNAASGRVNRLSRRVAPPRERPPGAHRVTRTPRRRHSVG
jgi:hypothetical protein